MKKLLFLIHDLGPGGAEKVLVNLVNNMNPEKFDITILGLFSNRWEEIQEHPFKFRLNCYAQGVKNAIAWRAYLLLYRSKAAINWLDKARFPQSVESINKPV